MAWRAQLSGSPLGSIRSREPSRLSYDLQVWSAVAVDAAKLLPKAAGWRTEGELSVWTGRGWQLVVGPQHGVDSDDIPEGVQAALPGCST